MREITPLREQQAMQLRAAVLEAVLAQLESRPVDEIAMADVASSAGISLRTLYRYFPDRASLLQAAGEYLYRSLGVSVELAAPEDIARSFREASRRLATRPRLIRALIQTGAGRAARSAMRAQRVDAIRAALRPVTAGLEADVVRKASAVIVHLCSSTSWVSIADESGLSDAEAQAAVGWAIDALIDAVKHMDRSSRRRPKRSRQVVTVED